ncbi:MAG: DUF2156 domain-containing protein [Bacteroidaceae bacterium]|nr:DUF2156 domain-containing protein [Bacteroidaceae bacterium]
MRLDFHKLTIADREAVQAVSLQSGRRNCNFTFANLLGWQKWFGTEVCVMKDAVVLRFDMDGERAYMLCMQGVPSCELLQALCEDCNHKFILLGLEDDAALQLQQNSCHEGIRINVKSERDQYDYIYKRTNLALLQGGKLKSKRNHVNRFNVLYPGFEYRPLTPDMFDECRRVVALWQDEKEHENPSWGDTIQAEHDVMETIFAHWDELGMLGGSIYVYGRMVAFTYGSAVTNDTFDVCVEKADRNVEGAFSVINQQFCAHLPERFIYVNREEDMGLEGLRKAKLSYHPEILLTYNVVTLNPSYTLQRMKPSDAPLTVDWITRQYGFDRNEVEGWVRDLHFNWLLSVKAVDENGDVIGLLNMSDYRIEEETAQIQKDNPDLLAKLNSQRYTAVFSFIVREDYRGTRLNYDMMMDIMPELRASYDFIFIPVLHRLKTHGYWQRWGAREFYRDTDCVYYLLPISQ